jgi:hypothetical protein
MSRFNARWPRPEARAKPIQRSNDVTSQHLNVQPNLGLPGTRYRHPYVPGDAFYDSLVRAHRDLSERQSELMQARLVLLLANHIGDLRVLDEAIAMARRGIA